MGVWWVQLTFYSWVVLDLLISSCAGPCLLALPRRLRLVGFLSDSNLIEKEFSSCAWEPQVRLRRSAAWHGWASFMDWPGQFHLHESIVKIPAPAHVTQAVGSECIGR